MEKNKGDSTQQLIEWQRAALKSIMNQLAQNQQQTIFQMDAKVADLSKQLSAFGNKVDMLIEAVKPFDQSVFTFTLCLRKNIDISYLANLLTKYSSKKVKVQKISLFKWFRQHQYLEYDSTGHNKPTKLALEYGLFTATPATYVDKTLGTRIPYTKINCTPYGADYFVRLAQEGETFQPYEVDNQKEIDQIEEFQ